MTAPPSHRPTAPVGRLRALQSKHLNINSLSRPRSARFISKLRMKWRAFAYPSLVNDDLGLPKEVQSRISLTGGASLSPGTALGLSFGLPSTMR